MANDPRLSRRPTEGRPVGSKRRLGRQPPSPEALQAIRPTPLPTPATLPTILRTGNPSAFGFLIRTGTPVGSTHRLRTSHRRGHHPKRRRPDGPPVPRACPTARYPTSPRPPLGLSPKGTERFRTASHPTGAPFPQRPLPHQPPASFPPRAREPRLLPKRAPRSFLTDSRSASPPLLANRRRPLQTLCPNEPRPLFRLRARDDQPPPPAGGKGLPPLPAAFSRGCRNDHSRQAFRPAAQRLSA